MLCTYTCSPLTRLLLSWLVLRGTAVGVAPLSALYGTDVALDRRGLHGHEYRACSVTVDIIDGHAAAARTRAREAFVYDRRCANQRARV